jgi:hypothetical protein
LVGCLSEVPIARSAYIDGLIVRVRVCVSSLRELRLVKLGANLNTKMVSVSNELLGKATLSTH